MLTKDLITNIAAQTGMTKKRTEEMLNATTSVMIEHLVEGEAVQIQNFGTLEVRKRAPRAIVHPKTGERSITPEKLQLSFRPTSSIKDIMKNI